MSSKIFIQIASYRDPDLLNTINNAIYCAKNPNNITFGICHQYGPEDWDDPKKLPINKNCRVLHFPYTESKGACWARSITQSLYDNENFTLQIDSHSRFEPDWDIKILNLYHSFNNPKVILSAYPCMFTPDQTYDKFDKNIYSCHVYAMKNGLISARPRRLENMDKPMRAASIAAGFIFGVGQIIDDVRYDPDFYFTGEEAGLAIRYFTNGYDLYHPNIKILYHYYIRKNNSKHWNDHKNWFNYSNKANQRLNCLLGRNDDIDCGKFGLGNSRTIEEWRVYSGIDYKNYKLHKYLVENKEPPFPDNKELWLDENSFN